MMLLLAIAWTMAAVDCRGTPEDSPMSWVVDAGMIRVAGVVPVWVTVGWQAAEPGQDVLFPLPECDPAQGEACAWRLITYDAAGNPDSLCAVPL